MVTIYVVNLTRQKDVKSYIVIITRVTIDLFPVMLHALISSFYDKEDFFIGVILTIFG